MILFKPGVQLVGHPAGVRILAALDQFSRNIGIDLTVTSGADGNHSGPDDPHHFGKAYDVRSHDYLMDKSHLISQVLAYADGETPFGDGAGYATTHFFGFLEDAGTDNEHIHFQLRKGVTFQPISQTPESLATSG